MSNAYDRLREYRDTHPDDSMAKDIGILLREVNAEQAFGGNYSTARRRMIQATRESRDWYNRATNAEALVETFKMGSDTPLWRRIANQRREIKHAWWLALAYQKTWRTTLDALKQAQAELRALKDA